jgi:hypothetical protein
VVAAPIALGAMLTFVLARRRRRGTAATKAP